MFLAYKWGPDMTNGLQHSAPCVLWITQRALQWCQRMLTVWKSILFTKYFLTNWISILLQSTRECWNVETGFEILCSTKMKQQQQQQNNRAKLEGMVTFVQFRTLLTCLEQCVFSLNVCYVVCCIILGCVSIIQAKCIVLSIYMFYIFFQGNLEKVNLFSKEPFHSSHFGEKYSSRVNTVVLNYTN